MPAKTRCQRVKPHHEGANNNEECKAPRIDFGLEREPAREKAEVHLKERICLSEPRTGSQQCQAFPPWHGDGHDGSDNDR